MAMTPNFDPGRVLMGQPGTKPYLQMPNPTLQVPQPKPVDPTYGNMTVGDSPQQQGTLGSEAVRATGTGPFDSAYRQNLATYAGGLFQRPGGFLGFNPTGNDFFGASTGGGNAPVPGLGAGLLQGALGGNPFSVQNPQADATNPAPSGNQPGDSGSTINDVNDWLKKFRGQGRMFGLE